MWKIRQRGDKSFSYGKQHVHRPQEQREYGAFKELKQRPEWLENGEEREKTEEVTDTRARPYGASQATRTLLFTLIIIRSHCSILSSKKTCSDLSCKAVVLDVCEEQTEQMWGEYLGNFSKKPGERRWQLGLGSTKAHCLLGE